MADIAYRLTGSSDLYQSDGRRPYASINFVTRHDGFTLNDLVSYNDKHNEANGEEPRRHRRQPLLELRDRGPDRRPGGRPAPRAPEAQRPGQPAAVGRGADAARRRRVQPHQQGNNNAYCQDNEISWVDWELDENKEALIEFTRAIIELRRDHPVFRRRKFFQGQAIHGSGVKDIGWFTPDGHEMDETHRRAPDIFTLGLFLNGDELPTGGRAVSGWPTPASCCCSTAAPSRPCSPSPATPGQGVRAGRRHRPGLCPPPGGDAPALAGEQLSMTSRSLAVLRRRA